MSRSISHIAQYPDLYPYLYEFFHRLSQSPASILSGEGKHRAVEDLIDLLEERGGLNEEEIDSLRRELEEQTSRAEDLECEADDLRAEVNDLRAEVEELQAEIDILQTWVRELESNAKSQEQA